MWWNGFLFKKSCVKLQFFINCCFFVVCYTLVFVSFFGPSTCFALLIPFLSVKKLNDLKKVIPIKLETQLYLLILLLSTWGYFYAHCCLRLLIFSCIYLIYILSFVLFLDVWPMCSIKALDKKNESQSIIVLNESWNAKKWCFMINPCQLKSVVAAFISLLLWRGKSPNFTL